MTPHHLRCVGVLSLLLPLAACSRAIIVNGKVVRGDVSFIGSVDTNDPRLKQPGLDAVEVSARGTGSRSDRILSDTHSDSSGDFRLRIEDQEAISHTAEFRCHLPGYADARQEMDIPPPDRRLLVVLKPLSGGGAPK
jgi:hypothetical protein